jgi:hypothetical protein
VPQAPKGWGLVIYHSQENADFVNQVTANWSHVEKRLFVEGPVPTGPAAVELYSTLLTARSWWEAVRWPT